MLAQREQSSLVQGTESSFAPKGEVKETLKTMIVRDRTTELEGFLKAQYETQIQEIGVEAEARYEKFVSDATDNAKLEEKEIMFFLERETESYDTMQLSSARLESERLKSAAELALVQKVLADLAIVAKGLGKEEKKAFCKALYLGLCKKIKSDGFVKNDFKFYCPKDVNINFCEASLLGLEVVAENDSMLFSFGLKDLLESKHDDVIKFVLHYIEDRVE